MIKTLNKVDVEKLTPAQQRPWMRSPQPRSRGGKNESFYKVQLKAKMLLWPLLFSMVSPNQRS
jgi:hypothetical protein